MIISGFTQRKRMEEEEKTVLPPGCHSHCIRCRKVECTQFADNVTACMIATCELCKWKCHECKMQEHKLNCPEEKVPCLNKGYGCPLMMKRSKLAPHLVSCPASVVVCMEEWSRWPMHDKEGGQRKSLPQTKTYFDCAQLDVALAMRDQRMLIDALHAPKKQRHALRTPLTKKFPVVPFPRRSPSMESDTGISEGTVSDDERGTPWDLARSHPGLESSLRSQLFRVTKEVSDSMVAALELAADNSSPMSPASAMTDSSEGRDILAGGQSISRSLSPQLLSDADKNVQEKSKSTLEVGDGSRAGQSMERSIRSSVSSDRVSDLDGKSRSTLQDVGGTQLHKLTGRALSEEGEIRLHQLLGVSLDFDCISRYIAKPLSMYSFTCGQHFRRDEYWWHFKNVHLDIHQGLYGTLLHRCPLAYQGCTFSYERLTPAQPTGKVFHSWLQESFGFRRDVPHIPAVGPRVKSLVKDVTDDMQSCSLQNRKETEIARSEAQQQNASSVSEQHQPSISDLANFDSEFFYNTTNTDTMQNSNTSLNSSQLNTKTSECLKIDTSQEAIFQEGSTAKQLNSKPEKNSPNTAAIHNASPAAETQGRQAYRSVRPVLSTGKNWGSKVIFRYEVEDEEEEDSDEAMFMLTNLPFEILQQIARSLDSFSLNNLALTSRLLRDVCSSLLEEQGLVILDWERQKSGSDVSWKVRNKRWMFSTSFEPIRSWKFSENHVLMIDHLKVCPFNQDKVTHLGNQFNPLDSKLIAVNTDSATC